MAVELTKAEKALRTEKQEALSKLRVAAAENAVSVAKIRKSNLEAKTAKVEDILANHQVKILTAEKTLAALKAAEGELQTKLTELDEAREAAGARVKETEQKLHELKG